LLLMGAIGACDLTGVEDGMGPGPDPDPGDLPDRIPNTNDPDYDQRLDDLGIQCQSDLMVTGTFTESEPQPIEKTGCWPVGEWRVSVTMVRQGCDPQDEFPTEFVYTVVNVDDQTVVQYPADPNNERMNLKITSNGGGTCNGVFEHYGLDLRVLEFHPILPIGGTAFMGEGAFQVWLEDPF